MAAGDNTRMKRFGLFAAHCLLAVVFGLLSATHASAADAPPAKTNRLLVYHAWSAPSELAAFKALVERFHAKHPDVTISTLPVNRDPKNLFPIIRKLAAGQVAPESFHAHGGYGLQTYFEGGLLNTTDALWESERLASVVPPTVRKLCQIDGHYYLVPVGIHRVNLVWYDKAALDRVGVDPSSLTSWDKFFKAAELLKSKGMASPIELGEGWTLTLVFQDIAASLGIEFYQDWLNGKITSATDPTMLEAMKTLGRYLSFVNHDHADLPWETAIQRVVKGESAFCFMGDWANGEFHIAGKKYGKDYGAIPVPGTKGIYGFGMDAFLQPRGSVSPTNGEAWLKLVASREGQDTFNVLKGSIPARTDPDVAAYDAYQKTAIADFKSARYMYPAADEGMPDAFRATFSDVLARFAVDHDAAKAARLLAQHTSKIAAQYKRTWSLK
jgi:glucose/mannose transport system substrate-binding protein